MRGDVRRRRGQPRSQAESPRRIADGPGQDEAPREGDHGADRLFIERLGHRTERPREAVGDLFRIGSQEDHGRAVLADQAMSDLGPRHSVQQVDVDQRQHGPFTLGDLEGRIAIHGAADDVAPGIAEHEFQLHRQDGLILHDHDPEVRRLLQSRPQTHAFPTTKVTVSVSGQWKRALGELVLGGYRNSQCLRLGGRMTADAEQRIAELERRVLGGYQLLQALVGIRLRSVQDPESRRHLTWLSDVVAAMGLINRRIVESGSVDFAAYLEDAAGFWRRNCEGRGVRIDLRAGSGDLPESHAVPLAIIVHELMSNAVRHAFPDDRRGSIAIACSRASDGISLVVRDSGVGSDDLIKGDGLALVEGLVAHLGGAMVIETAAEAGVGIRVRLPIRPDTTH